MKSVIPPAIRELAEQLYPEFDHEEACEHCWNEKLTLIAEAVAPLLLKAQAAIEWDSEGVSIRNTLNELDREIARWKE